MNHRVNYRQLAQLTTRIRQSLVAVPAQRRGSNSRSTGGVETTALPAADGEVQCNFCKMRFTKQTAATQEHNRHHPDCQLFDRNINLSDTDCLRYNALLQWIKTLKVAELKEQLKKYYQKVSGKKVFIVRYTLIC